MVKKSGNKPPAKAVANKATRVQLGVNQIITLNKEAAANNGYKRPGSGAAELWAAYGKGNITVGKYLQACAGTKARPKAGRVALAWDLEHGYITVK